MTVQFEDRNQVGADSGATSTPAWLADRTASTRAACFRDLRLAEQLDEANNTGACTIS